jgi:putative ABC transport system ATP-binding protein
MQTMHDLAHKHGRAVVVVTHDSRVLEFGDRTVHMEDGRIMEGHQASEVPRMPPQLVVPASAPAACRAC